MGRFYCSGCRTPCRLFNNYDITCCVLLGDEGEDTDPSLLSSGAVPCSTILTVQADGSYDDIISVGVWNCPRCEQEVLEYTGKPRFCQHCGVELKFAE
jgi:hypothetical protein